MVLLSVMTSKHLQRIGLLNNVTDDYGTNNDAVRSKFYLGLEKENESLALLYQFRSHIHVRSGNISFDNINFDSFRFRNKY